MYIQLHPGAWQLPCRAWPFAVGVSGEVALAAARATCFDWMGCPKTNFFGIDETMLGMENETGYGPILLDTQLCWHFINHQTSISCKWIANPKRYLSNIRPEAMVLPWQSRPTFFNRPKKDSSPQQVCIFWFNLKSFTCHAWCQSTWCFGLSLKSNCFCDQKCSAKLCAVRKYWNKRLLDSTASISESTKPELS